MKKILSLVLGAALIASMAVSTSAAAVIGDNAKAKSIKAEIKAAAETPKMDGVIGEYEYVKLDTSAANLSYSDPKVQNHTFEVYACYDKDYVYFAIKGQHDAHKNERDTDLGNMWNADGIQVAAAKAGVTDAKKTHRYESGFGLSSKTGNVLTNTWVDTINDGKTAGKKFAATDCVIKLDGKIAIYEGRIPAACVGETSLEKGDTFKLSFSLNTFVGGARQYIEWGAGTCASKDATAHPTVTLGDAIQLPKKEAPKTADATSVAILALAASLAAGYVVAKKH